MAKARIRILVIVLLLAGLGGGGFWLWRIKHEKVAENNLVLYGNVDIRQVQLAFNGSERIEALLVEEGDPVKAGQLLAELDTERLRYTVARADGQVQAQRQIVARLEAGSRPEEISKARAEVQAAEAEAINARLIYQRRRPLVAEDAVSREHADNAKANAEAAEAKLQAAREVLDLAIKGPRKEDIQSAKATLKVLEAELALAQKQLRDAFLDAPSSGVIQARILEPGDMASPQKPVLTLALNNPVWVRAYLSESDLGKVKLGMNAEISTDSYPGKRYRAWIGFISPTAQFTPKTVETTEVRTSLVYQVRIFACNPENELRLGMPATVTIPLDQPAPEPGADPSQRCSKP